jgi:ParB/RepB/Spo0J family partition protein
MRAERHYVDSITSGSAGVPIRLIAVSQFEGPGDGGDAFHDLDKDAGTPLDILKKSIRAHGIVQPLLVRKRRALYEVIAGKRRLAAAIALGLTEVPCVLHQVDDATARSLSAAENTRARDSNASLRATIGAQIAEAISQIADDVTRLQASLAMLRAAPDGFERSVATDLLAAQASRTLWLANTAALLAGGRCRPGRRRPLPAIVDDLVRQFEAERRLAGLRLELAGSVPAVTIDDGFVAVALTSAVMMTLSLLEHVEKPVIEIQTRLVEHDGISVQVVQRQVLASPDIIDRFTSRTRSAWTPMIYGLGSMALEHATAAHGGAADLVALDDVGSSIQLTFCRL